MPGPSGNRRKKKKASSNYGRFHEGYGELKPAKGVNPGAEVYEYEFKSSDAIRGYGSDSSKTRYGG